MLGLPKTNPKRQINAIILRSERVLETLEIFEREKKSEVKGVNEERKSSEIPRKEEKEAEERHVEVQLESVPSQVKHYKFHVPCP